MEKTTTIVKTLMYGMIIMFCVMASTPAYADSLEQCSSTTTLFKNNTIVIADDGNATTLNIQNNITCVNGCSYTLGACRYDQFWEILALIAVVGFLIGVIYFSADIEIMNLAVITITALGSASIAATDVFSWPLRSLFIILPIAISAYTIHLYFKNQKVKAGYD